MISVRTLKIVQEILVKAAKLLEMEINREESKDDGCPHTDRLELTTMGRKGRLFLCNTCGEQSTEEDEDEQPGVLEGRLRPRPKQGSSAAEATPV